MGYKKGETNYYVYLHRNKVTGVVFYVGKGKCRRAWEQYSRSDFWKRVVKKYGYTVEIVQNNLQEWYAFELEYDLILKYGRINNKTGTLVNMTNGGEGESGKVYTIEQRKRMSERQRGELAHNFDRTIYKYYNIFTCEILECLSSEFEAKTKCQHTKTRAHHYKGWTDPDWCTQEFIAEILHRREGNRPRRYSNILHNFVHIETLKPSPMTVRQFIQLTGKNPSNLLAKNLDDIRSLAGYTTQELIDKYSIEKIIARCKDCNVYEITNVLTGCVDKGTVEQLTEKYNIRMTKIVRDDSITVCGWRLSTCAKKIPSFLIISEFIHKDGRYFKGTRKEFLLKYKQDPAQLFRANNPSGFYKGWSLAK